MIIVTLPIYFGVTSLFGRGYFILDESHMKNRIKQLLFLHCVRPFALVFSHGVHGPLLWHWDMAEQEGIIPA